MPLSDIYHKCSHLNKKLCSNAWRKMSKILNSWASIFYFYYLFIYNCLLLVFFLFVLLARRWLLFIYLFIEEYSFYIFWEDKMFLGKELLLSTSFNNRTCFILFHIIKIYYFISVFDKSRLFFLFELNY